MIFIFWLFTGMIVGASYGGDGFVVGTVAGFALGLWNPFVTRSDYDALLQRIKVLERLSSAENPTPSEIKATSPAKADHPLAINPVPIAVVKPAPTTNTPLPKKAFGCQNLAD